MVERTRRASSVGPTGPAANSERGSGKYGQRGRSILFTTLKECGLLLSTDMSLKMDALNNNLDFESECKSEANKYLVLLV